MTGCNEPHSLFFFASDDNPRNTTDCGEVDLFKRTQIILMMNQAESKAINFFATSCGSSACAIAWLTATRRRPALTTLATLSG